MASRLLLFLLATLAFTFPTASSSQDNNNNNNNKNNSNNKILLPIFSSCSRTNNYTAGSQYKKNLDKFLALLPGAAVNNGWFRFYKGSAGTSSSSDKVFGLIMCYADHNTTECLDCLSRAPAGITAACPGSRNASAVYDACLLRYSATADVAEGFAVIDPVIVGGGAPVQREAVAAAMVPLVSRLTAGVVYSPARISNGSTPYSRTTEMYGLAQCTRDLNGSEYAACIADSGGRLAERFLNYTGSSIKGYSCYLRYLVGAPIDVTMPPARETAPTPTPGDVIGVSVGSVSILVILVGMHLLRMANGSFAATEETGLE